MKRLSRFILFSGSCLLMMLPKQLAKACGFNVYPGEYRFWLLQPDIGNRPGLSPFFFATTYLYHDTYGTAKDESFDLNINEWHSKLKEKVSKNDIDSLLYHTEPKEFSSALFGLKHTNSFARYLFYPSNKQFLDYVLLTKQVEAIVTNPDPWEEKTFPDPSVSRLIDHGEELYQRSKDPFIRLRTSFHLMRLYRINKQTSKALETYENRIEPAKTKSWIKEAALYQRAQLGSTMEGSYLYSKVFDQSYYRRAHCLTLFDSRNYEQVLELAKNNHERTVIHAMRILNERGKSLHLIKMIYKIEPSYKELPFILLREINKLEDWLETGKLTEFAPATIEDPWVEREVYIQENKAADLHYGRQFNAFLEKIINENLHPETALIRIYASHLSLLLGDLKQSRMHLEKAKKTARSASVLTQLRINEVILGILENSRFTESTAEKLMQIIQTPNDKLGITDPAIMKDQLLLFAGKKLIDKGDRVPGYLMLSRSRRALGELPISDYKKVYQVMWESATPSDYDAIIKILEKENKTAFEKFAITGTHELPVYNYNGYDGRDSVEWDRNKLLNEKAGWYIRNGNLDKALNLLREIPEDYWNEWPYAENIGGNPFYLNMYNGGEIDSTEVIDCNKRDVIEGMISLEKLAKTDTARAAQYYFELGNAWYNMSYYGKNWLIVKQWRSAGEEPDKKSPFNEFYFGTSKARDYYLKAISSTKDKKLAAFCYFMANECQNNFENYNELSTANKYSKKKNPYLKPLEDAAYDKDYYKELIKECATYQDFILKHNRWKRSP